MMLSILVVTSLLGNGLTAGVLFAVALSVLPALSAMPVERYVYVHQLMGRNWDPLMPLIVLTSMTLEAILAILAETQLTRLLFALGAILLLGVSIVSHFCNVPINRQVKKVDPTAIPAGWKDPRPRWRSWHLVRTALALLAMVLTATASTML